MQTDFSTGKKYSSYIKKKFVLLKIIYIVPFVILLFPCFPLNKNAHLYWGKKPYNSDRLLKIFELLYAINASNVIT